ncbi:transcriptional regulator, LacI family [Coriobacterium glomerans PW2]|uniref:Transcriptional regulator, LacI family n=1 Tax=Coriobacterium glomerans (strain ATCC 49209 / DSM 20642 / JCM 10262 / PW2) TaxID=700015 RepID=F2NB18_CORGP|nr:LacI family DNA-binding transcriptional regulator [Coriobacterium glomerans]AEB07769.1 transcriptional regulator, LacI family [Coriobacterium glomerans PW2]
MPKQNSRKRVTINDIAQMTGTSKTTVSFYINGKTDHMSEETRLVIQEAIRKTGYEPSPLARGMNSKQSNLLGVVIGDITNTFSNQIVKGITSVADEHGYRVLVSSSNFRKTDELAYIDRLIAVGVDGFIVQPTAQFKKIMTYIENAGRQTVFIDSKFYGYESNWVKTDNYEASHRAISACIEKGYERFLLVTAEPGLLSSRIERFSGFVDALEPTELGFTQLELHDDKVPVEQLQEFLRSNIDGVTPTLVFAPNCWALPDIYVAMREFYPLMPDRVGLLGFDNTDWASVASPSVSVVVQPAQQEGAQACKILLDLIAHAGKIDPHQVLSCRTQWGTSTL